LISLASVAGVEQATDHLHKLWHGSVAIVARDFERYAKTAAAFIRLVMIRIMLRRLTRSTTCA
jgi:hypothetical protein